MAPDAESSTEVESAKVALQIFSGTAFAVLAFFVAIMNTERLEDIRNSQYSQRLRACVGLALYVAQFSAFFNFFQLTELDDVMLSRPGASKYSMDMSRPIEWIFTCPLLQLSLVLLGGDKIPLYRSIVMPGIALGLLLLGTLSTLLENMIGRVIVYCLSSILFGIQVVLIRKQIIEVSDGDEGLFKGRSLYRVLALLIIVTWVPFPAWYLLTPEGFGVIQDVMTIEVGWGILNIVAKFSFIILVHKLSKKFAREQLELKRAFDDDKSKKDFRPLGSSVASCSLKDLATETLGFLGLQHRVDLFLKRLSQNNLLTCEDLSVMSEPVCKEKSLPWELIRACQLRLHARDNQIEGNSSKEDEAGQKLVEALAGKDLEAINVAKQEAAVAKVHDSYLQQAEIRTQDIQQLQIASTYIQKLLEGLLQGEDREAIAKTLEVAQALGATDLEKAAKDHLNHLKESSKSIAQFVKQGNENQKNKEYFRAIEFYDKGLALQPHNYGLLMNRSYAYKAMGLWEKVLSDASKALLVRPSCNKARAQRALALKELGEFRASLSECETGLDLESEHSGMLKLQREVTDLLTEPTVELLVPKLPQCPPTPIIVSM